MISYLKGQINYKKDGYVFLEVNNIGYKIFLPSVLYTEVKIEETRSFYTHQYIKEDALDLYGFQEMEELELFERLIAISGIGPKSALGVLAMAKVKEIKASIIQGDSSLLTKVSGIGKKTAQRVVLELKEKLAKESQEDYSEVNYGQASQDEVEALTALGYSVAQAEKALSNVDESIIDSGDRIRKALQNLN